MKRILITSPTYPPFNSGLGNAVAQQATSLAKAGHQVVVATGGEQRNTREDGEVRVETFVLRGAESLVWPIRGQVADYVAVLRGTDWDVILLNCWQNWATDIALRHLDELSGRHFLYSHCVSTSIFYSRQPLRSLLRYLAWRPYWWRLPRQMKRLDGLLFLAGTGSDSRFDDLVLARRLGVPLRIVPNSLSAEAVALLDRPERQMHERDRLIAVGSYTWQKGFDFVLRAYAEAQARQHMPLHLYGQNFTDFTTTLRALARDLGLHEGQVVFHEGVSGADLLQAYSRARLILTGSHTECQPLVLLDANASGTPFVARQTGCIASMPGGVAIGTTQEMTQEIDDLLNDADGWQALADAGRQAARDMYHPDRTVQLLLEAIAR